MQSLVAAYEAEGSAAYNAAKATYANQLASGELTDTQLANIAAHKSYTETQRAAAAAALEEASATNINTSAKAVQAATTEALATANTVFGVGTAVLTEEQTAQLASTLGLTEAELSQETAKASLSVVNGELIVSSGAMTKAQIAEAIATSTASDESKAAALEMLGFRIAEEETAAASEGLALSLNQVLLAIGAIVAIGYGIYKIWDYLTLSVDEASEALDEWNSKVDEMHSNLKEQKDLVSEVKESYSDLADGVNTANNANISLSDEEYQEFLDMNNELAEQFPELKTGLDDEGNAIIDLGGNATEAAQKLDELIKKQEDANSREIRNNWNDTFEDTEKLITNNEDKIKENKVTIQSNKQEVKWLQDNLEEMEQIGFIGFDRSQLDVDSGAYDAGIKYAAMVKEAYDNAYNSMTDEEKNAVADAYAANTDTVDRFYLSTSILSDDALKAFKDNVQSSINECNDAINDALAENEGYQDAIDQYCSNFAEQIVEGMHTLDKYTNYSSGIQSALDSFVANLSEDAINSIEEDYGGNVSDFLYQKIFTDDLTGVLEQQFMSSDKTKMLSFADLFDEDLSMNDMSIIINDLQAYAKQNGIEIPWNLVSVNKEMGTTYTILDDVAQAQGLKFYEGGRDQIKEQLKDKGLDIDSLTVSELASFNEIAQGATSVDEIISKWQAYLENANKAAEDLDDTMTRREKIDQINEMTDAFDVLDEIYADVKDGDVFDFTKLASSKFEDFEAAGLTEEYEEFIEEVSKSPNDINACQEAFNKLVTAYINSKGILDGLTQENKEVTIAMLNNMGVTNAEEAVNEKLNAQLLEEKYNLEELSFAHAKKGESAEEANQEIYDNIDAMLQDASATGYTMVALWDYLSAEENFNNSKLDVDDKIKNLESLAKAFGYAAESANFEEEFEDFYNRQTDTDHNASGVSKEEMKEYFYKDKLDSVDSYIEEKYGNLEYNYTGGDKTNKTSTSSTSADSSEVFDWIEVKLERLQTQIDRLDKTANETWQSWSTRAKSLNSEISVLKKRLDAVNGSVSKSKLSSYQKQHSDVLTSSAVKSIKNGTYKNTKAYKNGSKSTKQVYDTYASLYTKATKKNAVATYKKTANDYYKKNKSVLAPYLSSIQNGSFNISTIDTNTTEGKNKAKIIKQYQEYYQDYQDAIDAAQAAQEALMQAYIDDFDLVVEKAEASISLIDQKAKTLEAGTKSRVEANGGKMTYAQAQSYYSQLNTSERSKISTLSSENSSLQEKARQFLANGGSKNSKEYTDMLTQMSANTEAIKTAQNNIISNNYSLFETRLDEMKEALDKIDEDISDNNFVNDVLASYGPLIDKDSATLNDRGNAALYEYNKNIADYQSKITQAEKDRQAIENNYKNGVISKDKYEEESRDITETIQDATQGIISTQNSIVSLWTDVFNQLEENLDDLISTQNEQLQTEKDMYDYQKSIQEKTDAISDYRKQIAALSGDTSESNLATLQKLRESLSGAEEDLESTEWDRYISETSSAMSDLSDDFKDYISDYLENITNVLNMSKGYLATLDEDTLKSTISKALSTYLGDDEKGKTEDSNYTNEGVSSSISSAIKKTDNDLKTITNDTSSEAKTKIGAINDLANDNSILSKVEADIKTLDALYTKTQKSGGSQADIDALSERLNELRTQKKTLTDQEKTIRSTFGLKSTQGDGELQLGDAVIVNGTMYNSSKKESASGRILKSKTLSNKVMYVVGINKTGDYPYRLSPDTSKTTYEQGGGWAKKNVLKGYSVGSKKIDEDQMAWTQEKGQEVIFRKSDGAMLTPLGKGDAVFTNAQTQALWDLSKSAVNGFATGAAPQITNVPTTYNGGSTTNDMSITFSLPGVSNYDEFVSKLKSDGQFEKFVQQVTIGQSLGKNSLLKNRY